MKMNVRIVIFGSTKANGQRILAPFWLFLKLWCQTWQVMQSDYLPSKSSQILRRLESNLRED